MVERTKQSYSYYEVIAVYARDHATGKKIEQRFELTAPTEYDKTELKQLVADQTGRHTYDIETLEIIASGERPEVEDTAVFFEGSVELGP